MTRSEILEFVRRNSTSFMATLENGEPRVRAMETPLVNDDGLTFLTGANKHVSGQLIENPEVELCYWSSEEKLQLRLRGKMQKLDDEGIKKKIVEDSFTFLKPIAEQFGYGVFTVFRLSEGTASTWAADDPSGGVKSFEF